MLKREYIKAFLEEGVGPERKKGATEALVKNNARQAQYFSDLVSCVTPQRQQLIPVEILKFFSEFDPAIIKQTQDDVRYRSDGRQFSTPYPNSLFDNRFLLYGINQVDDGFFLSAAPENEEAVERFFLQLIQTNAGIENILLVGDFTQGEKYFNYLKEAREINSVLVRPVEKNQTYPGIREFSLEIQEKETKAAKKLTIYLLSKFSKRTLVASLKDNEFLLNVALDQKPHKYLIQCDTGLGDAPMLALSFYLLRNFQDIFTRGNKELAKKVMSLVKRFRREINFALFPESSYVVNAFNFACEFARQLKSDFSIVTKNQFNFSLSPVKKILILGASVQASETIKALENQGMQLTIWYSSNDPALGASQIALKYNLELNALICLITLLQKSDQLAGVFFLSDIISESWTSALLQRIPSGIKKIAINDKPLSKTLMNACDLIIKHPADLLFCLQNIATQTLPDSQNKKQASLFLGDLTAHGGEASIKIQSCFDDNAWQFYRLFNSIENYRMIPSMIEYQNLRSVFDLPSVLVVEAPDKLQLNPIAFPAHKLAVTVTYYMVLDFKRYLTFSFMPQGRAARVKQNKLYSVEITDEEKKYLGVEVAKRANQLSEYFLVEIVLSEHAAYWEPLVIAMQGHLRSQVKIAELKMVVGKVNCLTSDTSVLKNITLGFSDSKRPTLKDPSFQGSVNDLLQHQNG